MSRNKKLRFEGVGIRWRLFAYMMLFLFLLLGLLWLFQVVLFEDIYKSVRVEEIKNSAEELCHSIELPDGSLKELAETSANAKQVCVLIFDETGKIIASNETQTDCIIHDMSAKNIYMIYGFAVKAGGEKLSRFSVDAFRNIRLEPDFYRPDTDLGEDTENSAESIIFTKVVRSESRGRDIVVMLNTTISPVAATIRTLRTEILIITALMVLLAVLLSLLLARRVSRPIVRINNSAKQLAEGKYDADFSASGYKEITELSNTLAYAASELAKTEKLQRELISNISHDLRTPLTMITGYAEVMRDIPGENTPENVQIIIDEARRMTSLVNDVLDISKLQSGTQKLEVGEFNLTETIREVIGRFARFCEQDGYNIEFVSDVEVMVNADRTRILQVIYNFINNAITHAGEDKTVIVTQRIMKGASGESKVQIEVADHGEGIPEDALPNIWDRYYKVDKVHRRAVSGSGLGLSIVKSILELHSAEYGVISRVGEGSVFWFRL